MAELRTYRAKRDFSRTPEPSGDEPVPAVGGRFVVQEHHATALHWDVRLERDGVLASWAVPKGIPPDPRNDHLAVQTEDHPMKYLDFEGEIPEGEYGGGLMKVWDTGTYQCEKWSDREVMVVFAGQRATGRYVFFKTGGRNWMLHRMDPPVDPARELVPDTFAPAAPTAGSLPDDEAEWAFEAAWGGLPVVVVSQGGRLRIHDGGGDDISDTFPELSPLGRALGIVEVALEGELVAVDDDGRPDPELVERRRALKSDSAVRRHAERHPFLFLAADLVWLEGHDATPLPGKDRRRLLDRLELAGPQWRTAPAHVGTGGALLDAVRQQALPGIRGRRLDAPYGPPLFVPAGATAKQQRARRR
ncbi:MAG TPA: DNA polymerase ligase N-terminal domain-containing protein [Acidimicrobiales bacterium]|nr:DNA polymerase ligase N-terminal domain-containing protein [Acidimicrobiales bacterium]